MISFARAFTLLYIAFVLSACAPEPIKDQDRLATLVKAAYTLFPAAGSLPFEVKTQSYPAAIAALAPRLVRIEETGVYISMRRFYVREWGYFISLSGRAPITSGELDPALTLLAPNIYWYELEG